MVCISHSAVSSSLRQHGLWLARLLSQQDFPGKNTGEGCHSLLQGIFLTQGSSLGLLHYSQILYPYVYVCVSRSVVSDSVTPWTQNIFKFVQ